MLRVMPAIGERLQPALELLFSSYPENQRTERIAEVHEEIAEGDFDPRHLLLAEIDTLPVGAQLTVIRDNDVGLVWPPVVAAQSLTPFEELSVEAVEDALLREAARCLDSAEAWIGQSLLDPDQSREQAALQRNGFTRLTELQFFEHSLTDDSHWPDRGKTAPSSYEPYRRSRNRIAFANTLEATYRGTLDCPEFNGVRDGAQSLKNHEAAGSFVPDMWRLYRRDGAAVGVLLLVERPEQQAWEVLYLGVVEAARRSGIGRAMLLDALHVARDADIQRLRIVADARNLPAIALYESLGFQLQETQVAFVRLRQTGTQLPNDRPNHSAGQQ